MNEINYTTNSDARNNPMVDPASGRELVGAALEELETRGVRWTEILNTLANVAQLRGQHELAQILTNATHEVAIVELKDYER